MRITVDIDTIKQQRGPYVAAELILAELGSHYPFPLIALCGPAGCGKSTVARALDSEGLHVRSFAGPLKSMLCALGLTNAQVNGTLKEEPTSLLCGNTPRYAMQTLGTQWGRDLLGPDLWVNAALANLASAPTVTIIDDCRFANEAAAVRARGGVVIELSRAGVCYSNTHASAHASEVGVPRELIDATVPNDVEAADVALAVLCKALKIMRSNKEAQ